MIRILDALEDFEDQIAADNQEVTDKIKNAQPFLIDVVPAKTVIAELNESAKDVIACWTSNRVVRNDWTDARFLYWRGVI
jgi:hypothetical protein